MQVISDLPAENAAGKQIHHERGIRPAGNRIHIGESATQRRFGAGASKQRSSRSAGYPAEPPGTVVRGRFRLARAPPIPSSRISRSTAHRATTTPCRFSSSHTFRAP